MYRLIASYLTKGGGFVPLTIFLIASAISTSCLVNAIRNYTFQKVNTRTDGVVESFNCPKRQSTCEATIKYAVNGAEYYLRTKADPRPSFRSGTLVMVAYKVEERGIRKAMLVGWPMSTGVTAALVISSLIQAFTGYALYFTFGVFYQTMQRRLLRMKLRPTKVKPKL